MAAIAVPTAVIVGTVTAVRGDGFSEGFADVLDDVEQFGEDVGKFGDQHADTLTSAAGFVGKTIAQAVISGLVGGVSRGGGGKRS